MTTKQALEADRLWRQAERESVAAEQDRSARAKEATERNEKAELQSQVESAVNQEIESRLTAIEKETELQLLDRRKQRLYQEAFESLSPQEQADFENLHGFDATIQQLAQQAIIESDRHYLPGSAEERDQRFEARRKRQLQAERYDSVLERTLESLDSEQRQIFADLLEHEPSELEKIQQFVVQRHPIVENVDWVGSHAAELWKAGLADEQNK